jgi:3-methyladenine DNA glycosylase/8-oxoguanine DNA glycosylase
VGLPDPFSLELVVRSHGWYQCPPFRGFDRAELARGERLGDNDYLIRACQRGGMLQVTVDGPDADGEAGDEMVRRMTRMLRLDEDLSGFQAMAADKPKITDAVDRGWGRILRGSSLWEDVIKALMGTNVAWRQAVRMIDNLCRLGPSSARADDLPLVPTPAEVLAHDEESIRERVRCGYRAGYLLAIARGVEDGRFDLAGLDAEAGDLTGDEVFRRLKELPGIGPATAAYLMTFLGHYDRPTVDSATVAFAAEHYFRGEKRPPREVAALFEHYRPYRALGAWAEVWSTWVGMKEERDGM